MAAFSAAPVVEEKTVVPVTVEQTVKKKFNIIGWIGSLFGGGSSLAALAGFDWKALFVIVAAVAVIGLASAFFATGSLRLSRTFVKRWRAEDVGYRLGGDSLHGSRSSLSSSWR